MKRLSEYIETAELVKSGNCDNTDIYYSFLATVTEQFGIEDLLQKTDKPLRDFQDLFEGYSRISVSRFLNASAHLIKRGFEIISIDNWQRIMYCLLEDICIDYKKSGVEFLVLEVCTAILILKENLNKNKLTEYIKILADLDPYQVYDSTLKSRTADDLHNFCMYGICSEYLRGLLTGSDTNDFIERHWAVQKQKFNDDGMYMDPNNPMVYDITSRYRLALMLHFGYKGTAADEMMDVLEKGADKMMFMLSSDYKFPYGGRSNQYQFNEAMFASMCEFYCNMFSDKDEVKAGMFRACARGCISRLDEWMKLDSPRHIKNLFPVESNYGTDSYGNYNRYMITAASFVTGAIDFAGSAIEAYIPPNESGGYVYLTSDDFHKVFASCAGYSIEIDRNADQHYDATGLGRINYINSPYGLALGMPFAKQPNYRLCEYTNMSGRCIGPFWLEGDLKVFLAEKSCSSNVEILKQNPCNVCFSISYIIDGKGEIKETYSLSGGGISVRFKCNFAPLGVCIPVMKNFGEKAAGFEEITDGLKVAYKGWEYYVSWSSATQLIDTGELLYNRNGIYKEMHLECNEKEIQLNFKIEETIHEQITQEK
jgi:hypothetical protein